MDPKLLLLLLLMVAMIGLIVVALIGPSAGRASIRRLTAIKGRHGAAAVDQIEARMRRVIATRQTERFQLLVSLIPHPENLAKRLARTGRKWTLSQYMLACSGLTLTIMLLMLTRGFSILPTFFVGVAVGFGVPHKVVSRLIARRVDKFTANFPDALDLLVRGLRSGLPVSETMVVVGREIPGPVGAEFRLITEGVKIGKSMDQALQQTADRLDTAEFQFFCITLTIQRETGGNLAETLANLGGVLRQRAQMKLKIRAMSSESKASAYIIGVLPFLVFGMICWVNFGYMSPFFTPDPTGLFGLGLMQIIGIGGLIWMGIGAFIMAKMISFEI